MPLWSYQVLTSAVAPPSQEYRLVPLSRVRPPPKSNTSVVALVTALVTLAMPVPLLQAKTTEALRIE